MMVLLVRFLFFFAGGGLDYYRFEGVGCCHGYLFADRGKRCRAVLAVLWRTAGAVLWIYRTKRRLRSRGNVLLCRGSYAQPTSAECTGRRS